MFVITHQMTHRINHYLMVRERKLAPARKSSTPKHNRSYSSHAYAYSSSSSDEQSSSNDSIPISQSSPKPIIDQSFLEKELPLFWDSVYSKMSTVGQVPESPVSGYNKSIMVFLKLNLKDYKRNKRILSHSRSSPIDRANAAAYLKHFQRQIEDYTMNLTSHLPNVYTGASPENLQVLAIWTQNDTDSKIARPVGTS